MNQTEELKSINANFQRHLPCKRQAQAVGMLTNLVAAVLLLLLREVAEAVLVDFVSLSAALVAHRQQQHRRAFFLPDWKKKRLKIFKRNKKNAKQTNRNDQNRVQIEHFIYGINT